MCSLSDICRVSVSLGNTHFDISRSKATSVMFLLSGYVIKDNLREGIWVSAFLLWVRRLNEGRMTARFVKGQPHTLPRTQSDPS